MLKLVVLVSLFAASLASFKFNVDQKHVNSWKKLSVPHNVCLEKENISPERFDSALDNMDFPEDKHFKCLFHCFFEKLNFYNEAEGTYNHELMIEQISGLTKERANNCYTPRGPHDDCEHVFHGVKCAIKALEV
ncbi:hypothetical protein PPYR_13605 [Photinus pyralis]|uniref:Uncharacterized protein n=1 Tax=Photinus pyralis TaxID=7054 RepID=A0A1Y1N907_PHOPY|nr:uncharacterized protein LOC116179095 [Photinus pyralis]KAB0793985.1 hypothetical protein PPYR_13605 [Photinus pyralis]